MFMMLYSIDNEVIYFIISIFAIVIYDHNSAVPKL